MPSAERGFRSLPCSVTGDLTRAPRPVHPWLLAVAPTLLLYSVNSSQLTPHHLVLPVILSLVATILLVVIARIAGLPAPSAAFLASTVHVAFWSRGHLTQALQGWVAANETRIVTGLLTLLLLGALAIQLRRHQTPPHATGVLNVLASALVAIPLGHVVGSALLSAPPGLPASFDAFTPQPSPGQRLPDVVCVLLDAYGSPQTLRTRYGLDLGPFTAELRSRGFYVGDGMFSNYALTELSLSSLLNAENIDELVGSHLPSNRDRSPIRSALRNARVLTAFRSAGYRIVTFPSGYPEAEIQGADEVVQPALAPSEFHFLIFGTTALPELFDLAGFDGGSVLYDLHRSGLLRTLKGFPDVTGRKIPSFVLAHALSPHPPFVIDQHGGPTRPPWSFTYWDGPGLFELFPQARETYAARYREQVLGTNRILLASLDRLLAITGGNVVVLVFGDHGPRLGTVAGSSDRTDLPEAFSVFLAAYWPSQNYSGLHRVRTLVNVFPVLLNSAFGTRLPLREDRILFSTSATPYAFSDVTDALIPHAHPSR